MYRIPITKTSRGHNKFARVTRHLLVALLLGATACMATMPDNTTRVATPTAPISVPSSGPTADWWQPPINTTWQWQLGGDTIDMSYDVDMYDIDLFDHSADTVAALHAQGSKVVCYISVGSYEDWRPDADQFPKAVLGNDYEGWPGEKWLDIRQIDLLAPIMRARLDLCKSKGFDAVEPDNMDSYTNDTGFPLTAADQLAYNRWLAAEAHTRGLSIGMKNDQDQVSALVDDFDWALTEGCFDQGWCEDMLPFIQAGKPVFATEYTDTEITLNDFCPQAATLQFNAILKDRDLTAPLAACPQAPRAQVMIFVPMVLKRAD